MCCENCQICKDKKNEEVKKYNIIDGMLICNTCHTNKPISDYRKNAKKCKKCNQEKHKEWYQTNKDKYHKGGQYYDKLYIPKREEEKLKRGRKPKSKEEK